MKKNINGSVKIDRNVFGNTVTFESFMSQYKETIETKILDKKTCSLISEGFIRHWGEPKRKKRFWFF